MDSPDLGAILELLGPLESTEWQGILVLEVHRDRLDYLDLLELLDFLEIPD